MKKYYGIFIAVFIAIMSIFNYGCATAENEEENLWKEAIQKYQDAIDDKKSIYIFVEIEDDDDYKDNLSNAILMGQLNDEHAYEIISMANEKIISYMSEKGIDVSEKISELQKPRLFSEGLGAKTIDAGITYAFYDSEKNCIFINTETLYDSINLEFTYVHEVIHYLGCRDDDDTMTSEGLDNAITTNILGYSNGTYEIAQVMANQILIADPEFEEYIFNSGDITDRIDERLENVPVIGETNNRKISEILDTALFNEYYMNNSDMNLLMQAQDIVDAYCYSFNLSEDQKSMLKNNRIEFSFSLEYGY